MITATFPVPPIAAAGGDHARTLAGVAVPWSTVGRVSDGRQVRFEPGALDAAARPVLLRDHDRARPIGRVIDADDDGRTLTARARVSGTAAGDEALVLAGDGVLVAFSVGAEPVAYHHDDDGVLVVTAADWQELSLLTHGAFAGATVVSVTAAGPEPDEPEPEPEPEPAAPVPEPEPEPEPDDDDEPEEPPMTVTASPPAPDGTVRPGVVPLAAGAPATPPLTMSRLAQLIAAGTPAPDIMAALADITTTSVAGIVRPAVSDQVRGLIEYGRPVINAINRAPLPAAGMAVEWPRWTDLPDVGLQAAQKTEITTGTATIGSANAPVLTFAGGNDISLQAVQRSNPSFVEAYLRAAAEMFARQTEGYVITQLLAAAGVVAPAATFLDTIEAIVASLDPATTPSGPLFVAMSWDVGATLIGVTSQNGPAYWSASISVGGAPVETSGGGLNIFVSRQLPAKTILAGAREAATWYEDPANPQEIRVLDVSLLGLNLGVYGFAALAVETAGALKKVTFTTLPTMRDTSGDDTGGGRTSRAKG